MSSLFEKNVTTVAAQPVLADAAKTYEFIGFGSVSEGYNRCQLCHQRIRHWSIVHNKFSDITLHIGLDCHDKLAALRETGNMLSLRPHKEYISSGRRWIREHITDSMFAWLKERVRINSTSRKIKEIVQFIDCNGYPSSVSDGQLLVAYYKARGFMPDGTFNLEAVDLSKLFRGKARVHK